MKFHDSHLLLLGLIFLIFLGLFQWYKRRQQKSLLPLWSLSASHQMIYTHKLLYRLSRWIQILGIICLFIALARPQWGEVTEKRQKKGLNVLFAIDTSKSMLANDVRPNRLELAKLSIEELLKSLSGYQVGLIAFAGNAFLQCPITADYGAVKLSLHALDTNIIPRGGTNLSEAIELAMQTFDAETHYKQLILLTDGENLSGDVLNTARKAAAQGITIHTVGIGSTQGSYIGIPNERGMMEYLKDNQGKPVLSKLDEVTLKEIAGLTQGFYSPLGNAGEGLQTIYNTSLKHLPKENFSSEEKIPIEHFHWFAGLAILFLVLEPCLFFKNGKMHL